MAARMLMLALVCAASGCASTVSRHEFLGPSFAARASDAPVEVFRADPPSRGFVKAARLDVHLEKTGFMPSTLEEALPELKRQARQSGCDAIVDITERRSQVLETLVYHVTAYGIRYIDGQGVHRAQ